MKILKQILDKKLKLYNEFVGRRLYVRAIWQFYSAYNLAIALLNYEEPTHIKKLRQTKWLGFLKHQNKPKSLNTMLKFIEEDMSMVSKALNKIQEQEEKGGGTLGDLYILGTIGMNSFEFYGS